MRRCGCRCGLRGVVADEEVVFVDGELVVVIFCGWIFKQGEWLAERGCPGREWSYGLLCVVFCGLWARRLSMSLLGVWGTLRCGMGLLFEDVEVVCREVCEWIVRVKEVGHGRRSTLSKRTNAVLRESSAWIRGRDARDELRDYVTPECKYTVAKNHVTTSRHITNALITINTAKEGLDAMTPRAMR